MDILSYPFIINLIVTIIIVDFEIAAVVLVKIVFTSIFELAFMQQRVSCLSCFRDLHA